MSLFKQKFSLSLFITVTLLTACSESIQQSLAPDPKLQEQENTTSESSPEETSNEEPSPQPENQPQQEPTAPQLSEAVPDNIPLYPDATLTGQETSTETESGTIELRATSGMDTIASFYEQELRQQNWEIVTPFSSGATIGKRIVRAESNTLELKVTIFEAEAGEETNQILIEYQPLTETSSTETSPEESSTETPTTRTFTDLEQTPDPLQPYVQDMAQLGLLSPVESDNAQGKQFAPNEVITRRTFARWLFNANNRFYRDRASQQIRRVQQAPTPAFTDISPSDPDFGIIQGLAEAGLIPSRLTGDSTVTRFRPDAPLTRETLLLWKVPLDTRSNLPSATVNTVKETWGFQDAGKIDPKALGAIVADFSNGEQSTLRRVFGYTQLLQPEKAVTRAEAAAALWSFGTQGETMTAKELTQN
ncbi:S-layer domain-containing protein [Halothece sp. PCC 7418]|uniref:S-layer homology domain-containing protein n=1 Tax=Halothece sp. (strain PCC 7418) TaxID=65093 RepID=UPI0002A088C2|nr:S-layer homology domain-containing protein [Halothece sp. PCC 7418]AFZ42485.1 S-layer domain-containing protein [Halothece sp. PCC 7418]